MRKLIAIIPARGGSKRLKDKNIFPLKGKPLIQYTLEACQASKYISATAVSSDSENILAISEEQGATPILRPMELADDQTPKIMAIRDAIRQLEKSIEFDDVAVLQANSPQIKGVHVDLAYEMMCEHNLWEVMSVDSNYVQNAAIRILRKEVAFNQFLSAHCGFIVCDLVDVHTIKDIQVLEELVG